MAVAPTTSAQTITCPICGEDVHLTFGVAIREGKTVNGKLIVHIGLSNLEILAGCEHAEQARETIDFRFGT
jgi:hypothetical protein